MLRHHHKVTVDRVPDVVGRETVHVDLEIATVHVHIGDEQRRNVRSTIHTTGV